MKTSEGKSNSWLANQGTNRWFLCPYYQRIQVAKWWSRILSIILIWMHHFVQIGQDCRKP
jgi:hypothetical protein